MTISQTDFLELLVVQLRQTSLLEWFGTITGFLCVWLAARQHILNWPVAILSVLAYIVIFYQYALYGDAALQFYFLGTSVYGWYYWKRIKREDQKPVVSLKGAQYLLVTLVTIALSVLLGLFLDNFTDTDVPYIDGVCTAISFIAQLLMSRKVLQNWLFWVVADILYIPLYFYKGLALTGILYMLYLVLATQGYLDWKRTWTKTANL